MSRSDIGDELLTLLAAGHETTASTPDGRSSASIRHPQVLATLVDEAATEDNEYRQATILEVQRARTVIDFAGRHVYALRRFQLGDWVIPRGTSIVVAIAQLHNRAEDFADPGSVRPAAVAHRHAGRRRSRSSRSAAGTRRCVRRGVSPTSRWTWCCERCCGTSVIDDDDGARREGTRAASRLPLEAGRAHHRAPPRDPLGLGDQ